MVYTRDDFNTRVGAVDKKLSRRRSNTVVAHVQQNGIIYAKAKRRRRHFPIKGTFLMVAGFFCFKALMLAANGPAAYEDRLATLQQGTVVEAGGAWVLGIDPVTEFIAHQVGPLFR